MDNNFFYPGLFLIELGLLFFSSRKMIQLLSLVFFHTTKSEKWSIMFLALLFLPGVVIHEFAHYLMAKLLVVPVGQMEFMPHIHDNRLKLGSVSIAQTDPLRRFLIGVAPVLGGVGILYGISLLSFSPMLAKFFLLKKVLLVFVIFEVGNTMFSSRRDIEGSIFFIVIILGIFGILLLLFPSLFHSLSVVSLFLVPYVQTLMVMLATALGINVIFYSGLFLLLRWRR